MTSARYRRLGVWLLTGLSVIGCGLSSAVAVDETTSQIPGVYSNYPADGGRDLSQILGQTQHIPTDRLVSDLLAALDQITKYRIPETPR